MTHDAPADFDSTDLTIRAATEEDHATIRALFEQSLLEGQLRDNDTGADIENLQDGYFADNGASCFWVACHGPAIVGMIGVQKTKPDAAEIRRLRVREGYRRHGIGTKLMAQALDFCRHKGYLKVVLDVRIERGPAIAMFEKFGFSLSRARELGKYKSLDFYLDLYSESRE